MIDAEIEKLHETKDDPDEWEDEESPIAVSRSGSAVVSFRLPIEELHRLQDAATEAGQSLSQFIRDALGSKIGGHSVANLGDISSDFAKLILGRQWPRGGSTVSSSFDLFGNTIHPPGSENITSRSGAPRSGDGENRLPIDA